jgi:transposase
VNIASIGIDLGKTTFHLVALGERNKILLRRKFSRSQLLAYTANLPASLIGLAACAGAHFMGAALREQGHQVRLIPAQFVKPYRKSNKNDFIDAEAIAEAVTKQNMRFMQIKTQEQLDWQAMHRVRDRLVQRRTALINEIRGFLLERGITFAARPIYLRKNLPTVIEDAEQNLSSHLRWLLDRLWQESKQTDTEIEAITDEIARISNEDARCRQLRQIPGFGPLVSTATVAVIGNGSAFRRGRDFAAWVGVVPRQYSTGGKQKLYGISKRGNIYLRRTLIHGARAVLFRVKYDTGGFGQWVHRLAQRAPSNKVVVAIANKLARIAWAVLSSGQDYRHQPLQQLAAA